MIFAKSVRLCIIVVKGKSRIKMTPSREGKRVFMSNDRVFKSYTCITCLFSLKWKKWELNNVCNLLFFMRYKYLNGSNWWNVEAYLYKAALIIIFCSRVQMTQKVLIWTMWRKNIDFENFRKYHSEGSSINLSQGAFSISNLIPI